MTSAISTRNRRREIALRLSAERSAAPFPALLARAEKIAAAVTLGAHGRRAPGAGETFWEYRRHRREDGVGAIDWRRSARGDQLFVRESEWEAANAVYLWRDGSPGMDLAYERGALTKRDSAAVCLMALAALLNRGGERIAVLGEDERPRSGRIAYDMAARRLALGDGSAQAVEAAVIGRHARLVLASDFLDPVETWQARLARFRAIGAGGVLLRTVDPCEEDFAFTGRTRFEAPHGGDALILGRAEDARTAYRERWTEHGVALKALARRGGWTLITHRTDRSASEAVLALYQALDPEAV
ncbi:MAG: DUF58 domain-containing protein [Pseudomonadota bacterium]